MGVSVPWGALGGVARTPFLLLPVVLVASAGAVSAYDGAFSWGRSLVALVGLVALHVAVNVLNEISDLRSGIDFRTTRTPFSGGSGTLPSGRLAVGAAWGIGLGALAVGAGVGVWFVVLHGWPMVWLVVVGLAIILTYTPVLLRVGVGEVAAGLGLGALPVLGVGLVQDGAVGAAVWVLAAIAWCLTFNLLLLNEFPDAAADRAGGRRHLVILLGRRGAALMYSGVVMTGTMCLIAAVAAGWWPAMTLLGAIPAVATVPALRWALRSPEEAVPIPALAGNVVWTLATHAMLAMGFAIAALIG